jgi:hypothetical protein
MSMFNAMYPLCGADCPHGCAMTCKRAREIDSHYASRLAFALECVIVDQHGHWDAACKLLDEYKAEWERINPAPVFGLRCMTEPAEQEARKP